MAVWTYSDWNRRDLYPTDQARADRLALHIGEVAEQTIGVESQQGGDRRRKDSVSSVYLEHLLNEQKRLDKALAIVRNGSPARTLARFDNSE